MIRLLLAAAISFAVSVVSTWYLVAWMTDRQIGQPIREDGPEGHATKAGMPTMGGIAIVFAASVGYLLSDLYRGIYTRTGVIVMLAIIGGGAVGLMDDWIKVVQERNLGLSKRAKLLGLLIVGSGFATLMLQFTSIQTTLSYTRHDSLGIELGQLGWTLWAVLLMLAAANAVNLTDGLDGLAAGAAILSFAAFVVISFWQFRHDGIYAIPHALDTAVIAAAMVGALAGFLWWNASPAQIFMGDTGALAIGCGLAALSLASNTHLLLVLIAGLFVVETVSVIVQVGWFKATGRRVFRMAPIHHHFEIGGWPETIVIVRFWMIHGLCVGVGLGLYYADSISAGAV